MEKGPDPKETAAAGATRLGERGNDPLAELAPWHLRLHRLIRDIERGNIHNTDLTTMQEAMRDDQSCRDMCSQHGINRRFIEVEETKLRAVK